MKYKLVRGFKFPALSFFTPENIEDAIDYIPHDGDIVISSYPKTGTTWLQYIVFQIVSKGETFPTFHDSSQKYAPFMEAVGTSNIDQMPPPRMYKHHIPYDIVKKNPKAKTLYIYRRPDDACVSFYHFTKSLTSDYDSVDQFFEDFISGDIAYGHYFNNLLSHLRCKDEPNLLMISYEDLKKNTKEGILRIAEFLGEEYHQPLLEDESLLNRIIERTSFDYMKKNLNVDHPGKKEELVNGVPVKLNFFRKGVVGDGKNALTLDQIERLKSVAKEMLKDYDFVVKQWFDE